jgi:hypothetical protein
VFQRRIIKIEDEKEEEKVDEEVTVEKVQF